MNAKKTFTAAVVVTLLLLAAFAGIWYWITLMQGDVAAVQATLAGETEKERRHLLLRAAVQETESERADLNEFIITSDEIVDIIENIEEFGVQTGTPITFETVNADKNTLTLAFTAEGSFSGNAHLLALLEALPFQFSIERYWLEKPQTPSGSAWKSAITMAFQSYVGE